MTISKQNLGAMHILLAIDKSRSPTQLDFRRLVEKWLARRPASPARGKSNRQNTAD